MSSTVAEWVSQPDRQQIDPACGDRRRGIRPDAPGRLGDRPPVNHPDGLAQHVRAHVVQQHRIHSQGHRLVELCQRVDLELDLHQMADAGPGPLHRRPHSAGDGDVVVLDQHRIIQAEPVVGSAADPHRVFLREPQPRHRFAGAADLRLVPSIASAMPRVAEATPLRWQRKFSAVRSAVSMPRAGPQIVAIVSPGAAGCRPAARPPP